MALSLPSALRRLVAPLLAVAGLAGCNNACQQICANMKSYAEKDCGFTVSDDEYDACLADFDSKVVSADQLDKCDAQSDPDALKEWWTCDDVAENFQNAAR